MAPPTRKNGGLDGSASTSDIVEFVEPTYTTRSDGSVVPPKVLHRNATRFAAESDGGHWMKRVAHLIAADPEAATAAARELAHRRHLRDLEDPVVERTASGQAHVDGYAFVRSPSPRPGLGNGVHAAPATTWGTVASTPLRLSESGLPLPPEEWRGPRSAGVDGGALAGSLVAPLNLHDAEDAAIAASLLQDLAAMESSLNPANGTAASGAATTAATGPGAASTRAFHMPELSARDRAVLQLEADAKQRRARRSAASGVGVAAPTARGPGTGSASAMRLDSTTRTRFVDTPLPSTTPAFRAGSTAPRAAGSEGRRMTGTAGTAETAGTAGTAGVRSRPMTPQQRLASLSPAAQSLANRVLHSLRRP